MIGKGLFFSKILSTGDGRILLTSPLTTSKLGNVDDASDPLDATNLQQVKKLLESVGGGSTIQNNGVTLPNREFLNFIGFSVVDNGTDRISITQNSPLQQKGDLYSFSNVVTRLPVGADDSIIVADSTTSIGLSYKTIATILGYVPVSPTGLTTILNNYQTTITYPGNNGDVYFKGTGNTIGFNSNFNFNGNGLAIGLPSASYPIDVTRNFTGSNTLGWFRGNPGSGGAGTASGFGINFVVENTNTLNNKCNYLLQGTTASVSFVLDPRGAGASDFGFYNVNGYLAAFHAGSGKLMLGKLSNDLFSSFVLDDSPFPGQLAVQSRNGSTPTFVIRQASSQTSDFVKIQNLSGTDLIRITPAFDLLLGNLSGYGNILTYADNTGTIRGVTLGANLTFSGGTLSATGGGGGGSGTVTSVSGLSPLFTVANPTTTPTFSLSNQTANRVFASDPTGATTTPTFRSLVVADIPSLAYIPLSGTTVGNNVTGTIKFNSDVLLQSSTNANYIALHDTAVVGDSGILINSPSLGARISAGDPIGATTAGSYLNILPTGNSQWYTNTNTGSATGIEISNVGNLSFLIDGTGVQITKNTAGMKLATSTISRTRSEITSTTISSNYTYNAAQNFGIIYVNATSGNVTITLANDNPTNTNVVIKRTDNSGNTVTIDPESSSTIDGSLTRTLSPLDALIACKQAATVWFVI